VSEFLSAQLLVAFAAGDLHERAREFKVIMALLSRLKLLGTVKAAFTFWAIGGHVGVQIKEVEIFFILRLGFTRFLCRLAFFFEVDLATMELHSN
jgi:hypothetical protein